MASNWSELTGDPLRVMRLIRARIKEKDFGPRVTVESELNYLVPLHLGVGGSEDAKDAFPGFLQDFQRFLNSKAGKAGLRSYVNLCDDYAMRGATDGFASACGFRSVLQLLNDEFVPWSDIDIPTLTEDMEDIDETLLEVAENAPPVREHEIPGWVPASHWWWRAPKKQNMSEAERKSLLEYDHLDGVYD